MRFEMLAKSKPGTPTFISFTDAQLPTLVILTIWSWKQTYAEISL